jgi:hypothetical protein
MTVGTQMPLNVGGIPISKEQMGRLGFHVAPILMRPGSVVEPGNWGRIIGLHGQAHNLHGREMLLEQIRAAEFPHLPSRLSSCFYCPDVANADWFRRNHSVNGIVYLVAPMQTDAPSHTGYMNCLPPLRELADEVAARHYWRADLQVMGPDQFPAREVVTASSLLILQNLGIQTAEGETA